MDHSMPGFPVLHYLPEFAQSNVHWVSDAIQPSHSLLPPYPLVLIFPIIRVFSNELALFIRWPRYWSFSFSISISNKYSGLISIRIDLFDLFAVQETLWSLSPTPQFKSINSLALNPLYGPTLTSVHDYWKTIALTISTFIGKMRALHFNTLSRFIIISPSRSKCLLIAWLQSMSTVILEPNKIKPVTVSIFPLLFAMK